MFWDLGLIAAGLALLFFGGEGLVRGSVCLARHFGLSSLFVGIVIVGFGTSLPELAVSAKAALRGSSDIALGNVVGSCIANVLLIIGLASVMAPIQEVRRAAIRDTLTMTLVAALLFGLVRAETVGRIAGATMLFLLVVYVVGSYWLELRRNDKPTVHEQEAEEFLDIRLRRPWIAGLATVAGTALVILGAELLVSGAVATARSVGVPEAVIGLTVVAVGTSLPELATAIVAAVRKHTDVVLGNVIGSNIFNVLGVLGTTALITPIEVSGRFRDFDVPLMGGISLCFLALLAVARRIGRVYGAIMVGWYIAYTAVLYMT